MKRIDNENPTLGMWTLIGAERTRLPRPGGTTAGRWLAYLLVAVAALYLTCRAATAQAGASRPNDATVMEGMVRDAAGNAIGDVSVRLQRAGDDGGADTKTDAEGHFAFLHVGAGTYQLSAEKSGLHSRMVTVVEPSPAVAKPVTLILQDGAAAGSHSGPSSASAMEFADQPNFTVAAVTDWTAAGGHGSDASLRTSEALTRETLALKSEPGNASPKTAEVKGTEESLRAALLAAPQSFKTNHELGAFYLRLGKYRESIPLLEAAYRLNPDKDENELELAQALQGDGRFADAQEHVKKLMAHKESAELHRAAAELDEKLGDPLAAVHQYELVVRQQPSEQNYFEWGSELLLHRAVWQAKDVFSAGAKLYPRSERMLTALGAALFAGALYDDAARRLCDASDLNPADPEPYLFMGKIEMAAPNPLACVEQKLARFAELQPANPLANYFYAMAVWKQQGRSIDPQKLTRVEDMLKKAVTLDPKCSDAYLQLGVLESSQRNYERAVDFYRKAIDANPQLSEAHYRLGVAYDRVGDKAKARQEFDLHDSIEKQQAAEVDRQRREVKQFLVVVDGKPADPLAH